MPDPGIPGLLSNTVQNDDDFYGDQDMAGDAEVERQNREVDALRRHHFTAGLREGASSARDATLQGGFDRGFVSGAKATAEPGFILGACSVLDAFYLKNGWDNATELPPEKKEEREVFLKDLAEIRESSKRLRVWLRATAVHSRMDVGDIRQICERVVSLEVPDYPGPETLEVSQKNSLE